MSYEMNDITPLLFCYKQFYAEKYENCFLYVYEGQKYLYRIR